MDYLPFFYFSVYPLALHLYQIKDHKINLI